MNFLGEGLNPIYLFTGIVLVAYLHIVGLATNHKFKFDLPTILSGLFTALITSSPLMILAHGNIIDDYKLLFILSILLSLFLSIGFIYKNNLSFTLPKKLIISIAVIYIADLLGIRNSHSRTSDYGLYGEWFVSGSKFIGNESGLHKPTYYGITIIYGGFGSFSGMLLGSSEFANVGQVHFEYQVMTSLLTISCIMQLLLKIIPKIQYKILIPSIVLVALELRVFNRGFYGSTNIFFIPLIILSLKYNKIKTTIFTSIAYLLMVSTVIVVSPIIFLSLLKVSYKKNVFNKKLIKLSPIIVITIAITIYTINIRSKGLKLSMFPLDLCISLLSVFVISSLSKIWVKELLLSNALLSLIANLIVNYKWNITSIGSLPSSIMHRFLNFILVGEYYDRVIILATFPGAMHLLYEHFKTKKDLK